MKVKELIEILQGLDQEKEISTVDCHSKIPEVVTSADDNGYVFRYFLM